MKKQLILTSVAALAFLTAACGEQEISKTKGENPLSAQAEQPKGPPPGDKMGPPGKMPPPYLPPDYIPFGAEASHDRLLETYGYSARKEAASNAERGQQVYVQWCVICHGTGPGMAGTESLMRKYKGEIPPLLTDRDDLDADTLTHFVRYGVASMPHFRKTEISDEDLNALIAFLSKEEAAE